MNKVKGLRSTLNMTQEEMGDILGITRFSYSNKERGINNFKDIEKVKIIDLANNKGLKVTIQEIFFDINISQKDFFGRKGGNLDDI